MNLQTEGDEKCPYVLAEVKRLNSYEVTSKTQLGPFTISAPFQRYLKLKLHKESGSEEE